MCRRACGFLYSLLFTICPFSHFVPGATARQTIFPDAQTPNFFPSEEHSIVLVGTEPAAPGWTAPEGAAAEPDGATPALPDGATEGKALPLPAAAEDGAAAADDATAPEPTTAAEEAGALPEAASEVSAATEDPAAADPAGAEAEPAGADADPAGADAEPAVAEAAPACAEGIPGLTLAAPLAAAVSLGDGGAPAGAL